jgi:hypothetical protein
VKTVDEMTVKELREVKKALKDAESRADRAEKEAAQAHKSAQTAIEEQRKLALKLDTDVTLARQEAREAVRKEFADTKQRLESRIQYLETNPTIVEREDPAIKAEIQRLRGELNHVNGELQRKTGIVDQMSEELDGLYALKDRLETKAGAELDDDVKAALEAQVAAKQGEIDRLQRDMENMQNPRDLWGMLKEDRVAGLTNETHTHTIRWCEKIAQTLMLAEEGVAVGGIAAEMHLETISTVERVLAKLHQIRVLSDEEIVGDVIIDKVVEPTRWLPEARDVKIIG